VLRCAAGYGYNGRIAQKCDQGTYNEGDNQALCKLCPLGLTTDGVGAGKRLSDCKAAPGWGAGAKCPVGMLNTLTKPFVFRNLSNAADGHNQ
jgi:hypothetical protein